MSSGRPVGDQQISEQWINELRNKVRERGAGSVTSFDAYERLLKSQAGQRLHALYLRNTCLDLDALEALQTLHPRLQFMVIQASGGGYVSHFKRNVFPWRHLIQPDPGDA